MQIQRFARAAATVMFPFVFLSAVVPSLALAQAPHRALLRAKLQRDLTRIAEQYDGVLGVATIDLADSAMVGVNERLVFPQGSAIKIPILLEVLRRGDTDAAFLRRRHPITVASRTGGSGVLGFFTDSGSLLSTEDLAVLMIALSDNGATNLLIDDVGMEAVNRTLAALGLRETRLQRKMIRAESMMRGEENVSTPAEAASFMMRLARCALPLTAARCARMRAILELPKNEPVRSAIPDGIPVASKPGDVEGVSTSWALVALPDRPFALAVMTNYGDSERGAAAIRDVARMVLSYYEKLARSTPNGARVPLDVARRVRNTP